MAVENTVYKIVDKTVYEFVKDVVHHSVMVCVKIVPSCRHGCRQFGEALYEKFLE